MAVLKPSNIKKAQLSPTTLHDACANTVFCTNSAASICNHSFCCN